MNRSPDHRLAAALVHAAAFLVPADERAEWEREWLAEVSTRWLELSRRGGLTPGARLDLLWRVAGAVPDAGCLRWWSLRPTESDVRAVMALVRVRPAGAALAIACSGLTVGLVATVFTAARAAWPTLQETLAAGPGLWITLGVIGMGLVLAARRTIGFLLVGAHATPRAPQAVVLAGVAAAPGLAVGLAAAAAGLGRIGATLGGPGLLAGGSVALGLFISIASGGPRRSAMRPDSRTPAGDRP
ncbi:MAG TPA: hypothetical protein VD793_07695 [Gemmatimonadales bacterium]|nr:hypothetical protein [Gemmatimonadales bacterium]